MRLIDPISKTKLTENQKSNFEHTLLLQSQNNGIFEESRKRNMERVKVVRGEQERRRKEW